MISMGNNRHWKTPNFISPLSNDFFDGDCDYCNISRLIVVGKPVDIVNKVVLW